jgi:hypothetical protein
VLYDVCVNALGNLLHDRRLIALDNPVVLEGDKGRWSAKRRACAAPAEPPCFPDWHADRTKWPVQNFKYFASMNTMMPNGGRADLFSRADFSRLDQNRKHQTDWRLFSRDRF